MHFPADLVSAALDSTASATCQSSNKLGYSSGSANDSAAFELTCAHYRIDIRICIFNPHVPCQYDKNPRTGKWTVNRNSYLISREQHKFQTVQL